ncbi:MAG: DNA-3-methyladenine glycosylase I [Chloroflexota bacterium]|nr:DNA-3-methyladenine glycosylase I [Chloroflexota bacterium]MDE2929810.1 DNA-3-methyladenine glycosylase I [Chloroflexota bacterium]
MEAPQKIEPQSLADYLEVMSKAVFHSGMSWAVVEAKWPDIKAAMRDFDPVAIAFLSEKELNDLAQDKRVIRNRRKLAAIVKNAQTMRDLEEEHGSFQNYLRSHGDYDATEKDLRKRFGFLGETGIYYFLYVVGEDVPAYEEWCASRGRRLHTEG